MKHIYRSQRHRVIAGVCGGFADYFSLDPALIRLVWIFFTLFGGSGILAYILAMIIIPDEYPVPKTEPKPIKKSEQPSVLWGLLLVVIGIILLLQHGDIARLVWKSFWGSGINMVFALALIVSGVYLIYTRKGGITSALGMGSAIPLHLSGRDKRFLGVCGGIAESLMVDPTIVRFLWVFATFMSGGIGILLYFILAVILPKDSVIV